MDIVAYILFGIALLILIIWGGSEIFARVFFNYGEKFLKDKSSKLKSQENDKKKN